MSSSSYTMISVWFEGKKETTLRARGETFLFSRGWVLSSFFSFAIRMLKFLFCSIQSYLFPFSCWMRITSALAVPFVWQTYWSLLPSCSPILVLKDFLSIKKLFRFLNSGVQFLITVRGTVRSTNGYVLRIIFWAVRFKALVSKTLSPDFPQSRTVL